MTQFLNKSFSVSLSSPDYAKGWERAFGKKKQPKKTRKKAPKK